MVIIFNPDAELPADWREGVFAGRIDRGDGPVPVVVRSGRMIDVSRSAPTVSDLFELPTSAAEGEDLGDLNDIPLQPEHAGAVQLLSPVDLQCVKAAGVTFAVSAIERVIEERARGDSARAADIRRTLEESVGRALDDVTPGGPAAMALKATLIESGMWSQYLEVAIGPDAEIFTKAPVLASVGWGARVGVRTDSDWSNAEPEIALVANSAGAAVGATLGNDVNLRDFEGRSALLLGKSKDNNASCALGPFVRLFDATFSMEDVRAAKVSLQIRGKDGFVLNGASDMRGISRDPEEILRQCFNQHHYPDGVVLFLGTMFAPTQDRDAPGSGFTHKADDVVEIHAPRLGRLRNVVANCPETSPWTYGVRKLMASLARRGLLTKHNERNLSDER